MATTTYPTSTHGDGFTKHWDQSVPLADLVCFPSNSSARIASTGLPGQDTTQHTLFRQVPTLTLPDQVQDSPFHHQEPFEASTTYTFSVNDYGQEITPSDYSALRDTSRSLKTQRSGNMDRYTEHDGSTRASEPTQPRQAPFPTARSTTPGQKRSVGTALNADGTDNSAWIHRDKLAQIESREMAQAGIRVRHSSRPRENASDSRSASRSASRTDTKRNQSRDRLAAQNPPLRDAISSANRRNAPGYAQAGRESPSDDDNLDYDPAMLQDIPSNRNVYGFNKSINKSITSRIPVARASPAPISNYTVERDSPLNRNRAGSSNVGSDRPDYQKHRARSQSLGSSIAMDEVVGSRSTPVPSRPQSSHFQSPRSSMLAKDSPQSSPPKARDTKKQASSLNNRRGNAGKPSPRSRTTSSATRKTSPGTRARPLSASKRPEGDAPWIATMYKPDPRIPQDQQLLPTHAKRIMQGQSNRDREAGESYDRDFNLLDDNDLARMGAFPTPSPSTGEPEAGDAGPRDASSKDLVSRSSKQNMSSREPPWPLSPVNSETRASSNHSPRPGTSGGYKITPNVPPLKPSLATRQSQNSEVRQSYTAFPNQAPSVRQSQHSEVRNPPVQRVPDIDEKEGGKKDKSCGCCIMM